MVRTDPSVESAARVSTEYVRPSDFGTLDEMLYAERSAYRSQRDDGQILEWLTEAVELHIEHSPQLRRIAAGSGFSTDVLRSDGTVEAIPVLSSGSFKGSRVSSFARGRVRDCLSSGTRGTQSIVPRDRHTLERFAATVLHGVREFLDDIEDRRVFVLGPAPEEAGDLWFSYVLSLAELFTETEFFVTNGVLERARLLSELRAIDPETQPVLIGPPSLTIDFVGWLEEHETAVELRPDALVLTAGGWKRRESETVDRAHLTALVASKLGVAPERTRDLFNMVELNTVIFECDHHAKHIPPWLVVLPRRATDMQVAEPGEEGVLSFLDPTPFSFPGFILSDDVGRVDPTLCPCGRVGPVLRIERRLATIEQRGCGLKMDRYASQDRR
jgi:long-chain-fatty-acid---luciferin-component ligase